MRHPPAALDHVVKTRLEKNPDERFQTAQDGRLQLKWIAGGSRALPGAPRPIAKSSRLGCMAASIAFFIALTLGGAYLKVASRSSPVVRSLILPPAGTSFVTMAPASGPAVISPDGTWVAFTARDDKGKVQLYVR